MADVLAGLKPEKVWYYFERICSIPHGSKKEEKIAQWIINWAKEKKFEVKTDKLGNIAVRKPATPGMEDRKNVVLQGHIDMVCEKNSDVEFDFDTMGIQPYIDGDWVKAKGTTLGADNGIGVAMAMAVLDSPEIAHPNIEILCTLDEETGLTGAIQLGTDLISGDILINIDSEVEGAFTIGCAGGINVSGTYKYESMPVPANHTAVKISLKGLKGGHSGIEINDGRANAARLLTRMLNTLSRKAGIKLSTFDSGNKHNAIPREAFAVVAVPNDQKAAFDKNIEALRKQLRDEWQTKEPNCELLVEAAGNIQKVMNADFQNRLLKSFMVMPHGPYRMSPDIKGLVQTSTNFAIVETRENEVYVLTSQRSSVETEKIAMADMVQAALELGGAKIESGDGYPAWQPNVNSPILKKASEVYKNMTGKDPHIEAIHAGLECGLIGEKYPGMDMLSIGPNLSDVHSPDEKVQISSVERVYNFLTELLKNIPKKDNVA